MKEGDVVTLPRLQGGPIDLTIVGVGQDYTWSMGTLFMDRKRYVEAFHDDFVDIYHAYYAPDGGQSIVMRKAAEDSVVAVETGRRGQEFCARISGGRHRQTLPAGLSATSDRRHRGRSRRRDRVAHFLSSSTALENSACCAPSAATRSRKILKTVRG